MPICATEATKSWSDGLTELRNVWADPAGAVRRAQSQRAVGVEPFEFVPDMPGPEGAEGPATRELSSDELDVLVMPKFDGIGHGADWFKILNRLCPAYAKILRELHDEF